AADPYALEDAKKEQHDWRPNADRSVCRQKTDQECGDTRDEDGENEHGLAPDAVTIVAEDDSTDWARYETDKECRVRQQCANQRIVVGKEQLVEHNRNHHSEPKK